MLKQGETINEFSLRIIGKINLPQALDRGKRYKADLELDITDANEKDNNDGTVDIKFLGRMTGIAKLSDGKDMVQGKIKSKVSQKLRAAIWYYHSEQGMVEDFDAYYERMGNRLISYWGQVASFLESKN